MPTTTASTPRHGCGPRAARPTLPTKPSGGAKPGRRPLNDPAATWKLTIEEEEKAPRTLPLDVAKVYVIGREMGCDIWLPDRNITRRHAKLAWHEGKGWHLEDLGSLHGTFVNGRRLEAPSPLASGACVQVGDAVLMLLADELGASPTDLAPAAALARLAKWSPDRLLVLKGPLAGRELPLDRGIVTLGADPLCTLRLEGRAFRGTQLLVRPLANGRYEAVRQGSLRLYIGARSTERQILSDDDLLLLKQPGSAAEGPAGDRVVLEMRFLGKGKGHPTYPGTPEPVYEMPWLRGDTGDEPAPTERMPSGEQTAAERVWRRNEITQRARTADLRRAHESEGEGDPAVVVTTLELRTSLAPDGPAPEPNPAPDAAGLSPRSSLPEAAGLAAREVAPDDTISDPPSHLPAPSIGIPSLPPSLRSCSRRPRSRRHGSRRPGAGLRQVKLAALVLGPCALLAVAVAKYAGPRPGATTGTTPRPGAPSVASPSPSAPPPSAASSAPAAPPVPSAMPSASAARPAPSATPTGTRKKPDGEAVGAGEPRDADGVAARAEAALRARVFGGKASQKEILALRNLCARQNDRSCYDRAGSLLESARKEP